MTKHVLLVLLLLPNVVMANGKALHDSACLQCHAALMGGDANRMYQRSDRKIASFDALIKRVNACETAADANWNKKQKSQVVDYLNQRFYSFKN